MSTLEKAINNKKEISKQPEKIRINTKNSTTDTTENSPLKKNLANSP